MNFIQNIKVSIGESKLAKKLKEQVHVPVVCTLNEAKNIGIIYNATEVVSFEIIRNLVKGISRESVTVTVLGYVDSKKLIDHYLYRKGFDFFSKNELNWYFKPIARVVEQFIKEPFDLLIDLSLDDYYPIRYISAVSPALFKVGRFSPKNAYLDFMIDIEKEKQTMQHVHNEIMHEIKFRSESNEIEADVERKTETELQLNFLISQLQHYLSILKK
jgi:hypothetical protein